MSNERIKDVKVLWHGRLGLHVYLPLQRRGWRVGQDGIAKVDHPTIELACRCCRWQGEVLSVVLDPLGDVRCKRTLESDDDVVKLPCLLSSQVRLRYIQSRSNSRRMACAIHRYSGGSHDSATAATTDENNEDPPPLSLSSSLKTNRRRLRYIEASALRLILQICVINTTNLTQRICINTNLTTKLVVCSISNTNLSKMYDLLH